MNRLGHRGITSSMVPRTGTSFPLEHSTDMRIKAESEWHSQGDTDLCEFRARHGEHVHGVRPDWVPPRESLWLRIMEQNEHVGTIPGRAFTIELKQTIVVNSLYRRGTIFFSVRLNQTSVASYEHRATFKIGLSMDIKYHPSSKVIWTKLLNVTYCKLWAQLPIFF